MNRLLFVSQIYLARFHDFFNNYLEAVNGRPLKLYFKIQLTLIIYYKKRLVTFIEVNIIFLSKELSFSTNLQTFLRLKDPTTHHLFGSI